MSLNEKQMAEEKKQKNSASELDILEDIIEFKNETSPEIVFQTCLPFRSTIILLSSPCHMPVDQGGAGVLYLYTVKVGLITPSEFFLKTKSRRLSSVKS